MTKDVKLTSPTRRDFFRKAGTGAIGAVVLGVTAGSVEAAEPPDRDHKSGAYRETDHVKSAYHTARF